METKLIPSPEMKGVKVGLWFTTEQIIYVSQAIYDLCEDDLDLMRKNLKVLKMPRDELGVPKHNSVQSWLDDLRINRPDVFTE